MAVEGEATWEGPTVQAAGKSSREGGQRIMENDSKENDAKEIDTKENDTKEEMFRLLEDLQDFRKRDTALHELSRRRESFPNLAAYLWHSYGTITIFLQEIVSV